MHRDRRDGVARRAFLSMLAASVAGVSCARRFVAPPPPPKANQIKLPPGGKIQTRRLGRTGVDVSMVGLGGHHIARGGDERLAVRLVRKALDHGITFLDNCWDYNEGRSEEWMGKTLRNGYRQRAFLMTKLDGRTRGAAMQQLEQSLRRLKTDVIDLVQIHEVIRLSDPARVFDAGGAMEALLDARRAGKIRFIGFTGHKDPAIHMAMLLTALENDFEFDTVQMPLNVMDPHYHSFEKHVLPSLVQANIGVLGMKPMGDGEILKSNAVTAEECLRYSLSLPTSVVITGCETEGVLDQAIDVAMRFSPLDGPEKEQLLAHTKPHATDGRYEGFKTSEDYDGTTRHPEWLDSAKM